MDSYDKQVALHILKMRSVQLIDKDVEGLTKQYLKILEQIRVEPSYCDGYLDTALSILKMRNVELIDEDVESLAKFYITIVKTLEESSEVESNYEYDDEICTKMYYIALEILKMRDVKLLSKSNIELSLKYMSILSVLNSYKEIENTNLDTIKAIAFEILKMRDIQISAKTIEELGQRYLHILEILNEKPKNI